MNGSSEFDPTKPPMTSEMWAAIESVPLSGENPADSLSPEALQALAQDERLRATHERIVALDHRIAVVIHDVPLPEGLANRVAEAVALSPVRGAVVPIATASTSLGLGEGAQQARSRRFWLAAGSAAVVASIVLLAMALTQWNADPAWNVGQLAEAAAHFCLSGGEQSGDARTDAPPSDFPFGRGVVVPSVNRWRLIGDFFGREAVAYELPSIGGHRATLYVARLNISDPLDAPPQKPDFSTGRCAVAIWQRQGVAYLLVVVGDQPVSAYPWFLERPTSPLT